MNISLVLKKRKLLFKSAGKSYFFFCTLLVSVSFLSAAIVIFSDKLFKAANVSASIMSAVTLLPSAPSSESDFLLSAVSSLSLFLSEFLSHLPTSLVFLFCLIFLISPIYQGTIRWSAYLIEEKKSLPIAAAVFYFTSPSLYFRSVFLSIKLVLLKLLSFLMFFLVPTLFLLLGITLSSDYIGQKTFGSAVILLSLFLFLPIFVLYLIFCTRFSAVRYLFALGNFNKIFVASKKITQKRRVKAFVLSLRLCLNFLPALLLLPAPACLSQIICGKCLFVNSLLIKKAKPSP